MLRSHCMQQWYNLSDPAMEDSLYEINSMRLFAGLSLDKAIPDHTTIMPVWVQENPVSGLAQKRQQAGNTICFGEPCSGGAIGEGAGGAACGPGNRAAGGEIIQEMGHSGSYLVRTGLPEYYA